MKIRPVGAELLYAERRRVTTKLTVACNNSANTGKKKGKIRRQRYVPQPRRDGFIISYGG